MRRKLAIGTLSFMILVGTAILTRGQEGPPPEPGPEQAENREPGGGQPEWGGGQHQFEGGPGRFAGPEGPGGPMGWHPGGGPGFGGGEHLLRMAENPHVRQFLGLTDDQVERLHKIGVDAEKASVQTRADLELHHIELCELMRADDPNRDAIMQKIDQVAALRGKMEKQHVETLLAARSVLTPEQLKKVKAFREHAGFGEHEHGRMMEHRGGPERHPGAPDGSALHPQQPPQPPAQ